LAADCRAVEASHGRTIQRNLDEIKIREIVVADK